MAEERAAAFTRRSIKTSAKLAGLKLVVSMMDLTTLEGSDTQEKSPFFAAKPCNPSIPATRCRVARPFASIQISLESRRNFSNNPALKSPLSQLRFPRD